MIGEHSLDSYRDSDHYATTDRSLSDRQEGALSRSRPGKPRLYQEDWNFHERIYFAASFACTSSSILCKTSSSLSFVESITTASGAGAKGDTARVRSR